MIKLFVSYRELPEMKRKWLHYRSESLSAIFAKVQNVASYAVVDYVRIEREE